MSKEVQVATLLHDIGKPIAREVDEARQKVRFVGHEGRAFFKVIQILDEMEEEFSITKREKINILSIVSLHGSFFDMLQESNAFPEFNGYKGGLVSRFRWYAELWKLLVNHLTCDTLGKFGIRNDEVDPLLLPVFYKEVYDRIDSSLDMWRMPVLSEYALNSENHPYLMLLIGPPLAGKTTFVKGGVNAKVLRRDDIIMELSDKESYTEAWASVDQKEVDRILAERFSQMREARENIVIDMTSCSRKSRRKWLSQIPGEYKKIGVVFATDYDTILERNRLRDKEEGKFIPWVAMRNMFGGFTVPTYDEFDYIWWQFNVG